MYMVLEYGDIDLARLLHNHEEARRKGYGSEGEIDANFIRLYWQQMLQVRRSRMAQPRRSRTRACMPRLRWNGLSAHALTATIGPIGYRHARLPFFPSIRVRSMRRIQRKVSVIAASVHGHQHAVCPVLSGPVLFNSCPAMTWGSWPPPLLCLLPACRPSRASTTRASCTPTSSPPTSCWCRASSSS